MKGWVGWGGDQICVNYLLVFNGGHPRFLRIALQPVLKYIFAFVAYA